MFSLSPMTLRLYQRSKDPRQRTIAELALRPRALFVTLFILNVGANILIQNIISDLLGPSASWWLKVGLPLALVLLCCEILPKYFALHNNVSLSYALAPLVSKLSSFLQPLRAIILSIVVPISRAMFFFLKRDEPVSREEMQHVLKTSLDFGVLHPDEIKLVSGYLDLRDKQVKELMKPRGDVLFYDIHKPLSKLSHLFADEKCSRLPVCEENIQNVKGILSAVTFFVHRDHIQHPSDVLRFLDKPFYVPETTPVRKLIQQLNERDDDVALVVDEYGALVGLITQEDLVEVVTGEISDERDEKSLYTQAGENTIIASGKLELKDFNEIFGVQLESANNMLTLGGWLTEQLGDIPKSGTKYLTGQFLFQVLAADPNRIRRIYVRKLTPTKESA